MQMKVKLLKFISGSRIMRAFLESPSPRWMVFAADLLMVLLSCVLTYAFNPNVTSTFDGWLYTPTAKIALITVVYSAFGLFMGTYAYVIRLSVIEDVYRIVQLCLTASMTLLVASLVASVSLGQPYFSIWNLFTVSVFSFSLMVLSRLVIKYAYTVITALDSERTRVIMLGSSINSLLLASALKIETGGRFRPVAMLSVGKASNNSYNGIPVEEYNEATVGELFEKYRCETLIFLNSQMELVRSQLVDVFLEHDIKLLMLNQVEEFSAEPNEDSTQTRISAHVHNIKIEDLLGRDTIKTDKSGVRHTITGQVVMITGAAGSIGSEIVNQVAQMGASEIILVDQAETPMHDMQLMMEKSHPDVNVQLFIGDVANQQRMEFAFECFKPRYVFHAAAYKHVPMMEKNPCEAVLTNVFGTKIMADLAVKYNVEKFVMVSTDKAVNPTNVMGASKRIAEIYVQSLFYHMRRRSDRPTTQFITTRFGNVLGSNGSVIPLFRRQIEAGGPVTVTHRDIIRYFMTIPEACSLVLEAGCMGRGGEIYVFDMGKPVKIYDLARRMIKLAGLRPDIDIKIEETGLRPGEKLYEELLSDRETTVATHHKKIMAAKVRTYDYADVLNHLNVLHNYVKEGHRYALVNEMKHMVPEFKSKNSMFESIDQQITAEVKENPQNMLQESAESLAARN